MTKKPVNLYLDPVVWQEYRKLMIDKNTSSSLTIEQFMKKEVKKHGKSLQTIN